mgnify:CR=1 FL=1
MFAVSFNGFKLNPSELSAYKSSEYKTVSLLVETIKSFKPGKTYWFSLTKPLILLKFINITPVRGGDVIRSPLDF